MLVIDLINKPISKTAKLKMIIRTSQPSPFKPFVMRKSSAPSQLGSGEVKRIKFSTPFLSGQQKDISETSNTKIDKTPELKKARSNEEILKLITTAKSEPQCLLENNSTPSVSLQCEDNKCVKASPAILKDSPINKCSDKKSAITYFNVVWCKLSKKKHKTWEGDAILKVQGRNLLLLDTDGKIIGNTSSYNSNQLSDLKEGQTLIIGQKEIEILSPISEEDFNKGKCFQANNSCNVDEEINCTNKYISKPFVKPSKADERIKQDPSLVRDMTTSSRNLTPPLGSFVLPRPSDSHQYYNNPNGLPVVDVYVDLFLSKHLRPHQKEGVAFLYKCVLGINQSPSSCKMVGGAILADEMGLGKTLQCISLICTLYKQGPYGGKPILKKVLIVVPGSLVKNWYKEFKKWVSVERLPVYAVSQNNKVQDYINLHNNPVLIISYEMLVRNVNDIKKVNFDLVVCDEGHRLKNCNIKTAQCINSLDIKRKIVLTGTPVQNDLQELFSLVDFCSPGVLGSMSSFKHVFENPILNSRQSTATPDEISLGQQRALELNRITGQLILRRTQEINNQYLPPKIDIVLICAMTPLQLILYNKLVSSRAIKMCINNYQSSSSSSSSSMPQHLACISALRRLCNHPDLIYEACQSNQLGRGYGDDDDEEEEVEKENMSCDLFEGLLSCYPGNYAHLNDEDKLNYGGKLMVLMMMLSLFKQNDAREKVVVVSNFTKTLDLIEKLCKINNYQFLRLDGKTQTFKRQELVERFNNPAINDFVFLLSTKAGGVGLNLVGASRLILFDIDWNPATDLQAMARVWRDGQRRRTFIYRLLSTWSIEERMFQRQISKQALSGVVVDLKSVDSKNQLMFSKEQLKELFSPIAIDDGNDVNGIRGVGECRDVIIGRELSLTHEMLDCRKCKKSIGNTNLGDDVDEDLNLDDDDDEQEDDVDKQHFIGNKTNVNMRDHNVDVSHKNKNVCDVRLCQLLADKNKKNSCMEELLDWKHMHGPNPDLSQLDPSLKPGAFPNVTFAFSAESNN